MTSPIGAPGPGGRAGVVEVGDVVEGAARVVLGGTVNDGVDRSASPPTECEHPATSTDAAISPAIRITAKASGPTRDRWPGAAARLVRYRRIMHEHVVRATIESGTVEGFTRDGVNRWRSIPYARPPVGRLRLRAPQPVEPWPGVRYCHGFGYCAPQQRMYTILAPGKYQPMSEDCLTLNVVTPKRPADHPLPVMVFIHGGGYFMGSSATPIYDGAALARKGCVYVSVNYRLGALGCLDLSSLSDKDITIDDNLFLRDLVMALRWVRDNIAVFGGDPDNVTIFGESAGAHAVATLLAVPAAKGLFAQAISESPATGMVRSPDIAAEYATKFAALLGARKEDGAHAVMAARPAELVNAFDRVVRQGQREMLGAFAAGPTQGTDYLPLDPVAAMRDGKAHSVPLIVGTNAEEARLFGRFLKLLPMTEPMIERLLAGRNPVSANGLPPPIRATRTLRPASSSAAISRSDRPRGRSPRRTAGTPRPTSTVTTTRRARCAGRAWAPRMPPSCWRCSTSTAQSSAGCLPPRLTGVPRCGSATTCRPAGGHSAVPACPARTGPRTPAPTVR